MLDHMILTVSNVERSLAFYEALGTSGSLLRLTSGLPVIRE